MSDTSSHPGSTAFKEENGKGEKAIVEFTITAERKKNQAGSERKDRVKSISRLGVDSRERNSLFT